MRVCVRERERERMSFAARGLFAGARRAAAQQGQRRNGSTSSKGGFWSEGTKEKTDGLLFGESPPAAGQSRKWESWEAPWYATLVGSVVLLTLGLSAKPNNGITSWAKEEAMKRRYGN